jgi:hypothetical protein
MNGKIVGAGLLTVALVTMAASGCSSVRTTAPATPLPPAKAVQPSDLASLAGEWHGTLRGVAGSSGPLQGRTVNVRVTLAPDGTFTSNVDGMPGMGTSRVAAGVIVFEGSTTRGTATLHEGGGRRVLKGQGSWVGFDGQSEFEVTKQ